MSRITTRDLEVITKRLNDLVKPAPKREYVLYFAYGGVELHKLINDARAVTVISTGGCVTKRDLYNQLNTLIDFIYSQEV